MASLDDILVVSNSYPNNFASRVSKTIFGHDEDRKISRQILLKNFSNGEFCPTILIGRDAKPGYSLEGKTIYIVSTEDRITKRTELMARTFLIAGAAKENGAEKVCLVEPDLYFSAQDRGPRTTSKEHHKMSDIEERRKFVGQAHSAKLYASLLKTSGVDQVITVHNHNIGLMRKVYADVFGKEDIETRLIDLDTSFIFAHYLQEGSAAIFGQPILLTENAGEGVTFISPDAGAKDYVDRVQEASNLPKSKRLVLGKNRIDEHTIVPCFPDLSHKELKKLLHGQILVSPDDMVRSGTTQGETGKLLYSIEDIQPMKFIASATHCSPQIAQYRTLDSPYITDLIFTNTIPSVNHADINDPFRERLHILRIATYVGEAIKHGFMKDENPADLFKPGMFTEKLYRPYVPSDNYRRRT